MMPEYGVGRGDMETEMGDDHIQQINLRRVNDFKSVLLLSKHSFSTGRMHTKE
jgi:hypothetical protein